MSPDLSDRDRDRFAALRDSLDGVKPNTQESTPSPAQRNPFDPMLAAPYDGDLERFDPTDWIAERKYDGTRIVLQKFDGTVSLYTRRHIDRAETLADLTDVAEATLPDGLILDGEYCYLTPEGTSRFLPIHHASGTVEAENLSGTYFAFDVLAIDSTWCLRDPLLERKDRLGEFIPSEEMITSVSYETEEFEAYYDRIVDRGEEGIIMKRRSSPYHRGTRSEHWQKIKAFSETDLLAVGFTPGEGTRAETFGALVLSDGEEYVGRVGSGFDRDTLRTLRDAMTPVSDPPFSRKRVGRDYTPIVPMVVRVSYQEINRDGKLRAPVFVEWRPEKPAADVQPLAASSSNDTA